MVTGEKVLHRVVATVKLLAKLRLPFRGHREHELSRITVQIKTNEIFYRV
jgi:hypothetical protein